ncbi:hypothetical protein EJ110_NYTH46646 [Nymphaea thermarum]|nr:hypothetical protein EJ110_NYTH46646 [Nymphaea thermarum]
MDSYIVIQRTNYERKSSIAEGLSVPMTKDQGSNPVWNEKISFPVQLPCVDDQFKFVLRILHKETKNRQRQGMVMRTKMKIWEDGKRVLGIDDVEVHK